MLRPLVSGGFWPLLGGEAWPHPTWGHYGPTKPTASLPNPGQVPQADALLEIGLQEGEQEEEEKQRQVKLETTEVKLETTEVKQEAADDFLADLGLGSSIGEWALSPGHPTATGGGLAPSFWSSSDVKNCPKLDYKLVEASHRAQLFDD